jgi:hypothetical protein
MTEQSGVFQSETEEQWVEAIVCRGCMYRGEAKQPGDIIRVPVKHPTDGVYPLRWWRHHRKAAATEEEFEFFRNGLAAEGVTKYETKENPNLGEPEGTTADPDAPGAGDQVAPA